MVVYDGFILQLTAMVVKDGSTFTTWLLVMVIFKFVKPLAMVDASANQIMISYHANQSHTLNWIFVCVGRL